MPMQSDATDTYEYTIECTLTSKHKSLIRSASSLTSRKHSLGRYTSSMYVVICKGIKIFQTSTLNKNYII